MEGDFDVVVGGGGGGGMAAALAAADAGASVIIAESQSDLGGFPDGSFDFVLSYIVLQHIPRSMIPAYLHEFARVLRPGGGAFFSLPASPARTPRGLVYRFVPQAALVSVRRLRNGAAMRMSHLSRDRVGQLIGADGLEVRAALPSMSVGPDWKAFDYVVRHPYA